MRNQVPIIPINEVTDYRTGDVLVSKVKFLRHFAILFYQNGKPLVADNSFGTARVDVFNLDEYRQIRDVIGIIRTPETEKLTDEAIEQGIEEAKITGYKFFKFNCEDFIRSICHCYIGDDQRVYYAKMLLGIIVIIMAISILRGIFK